MEIPKDKTIEKLKTVPKDYNTNRLQSIIETSQNSLEQDLRRAVNLSDKKVSILYADAYLKNHIKPDEFEIEDEQMEKFWNMVSL